MPPREGFEIVGRVDQGRDEWADADVAIDFSTADALLSNFKQYTSRRLPAVIGTTGWNAHVDQLRAEAQQAGIGVVASGNFSIGVNVFQLIVAEAAKLMTSQPQFGTWIHEIHHAAKRDAPSGTALLLRDAMVAAGFNRPDRHLVSESRYDPGHAHCWIRQRIGYDRVDPPCAGSPRLCERRIAGGSMDPRAHRLVHHAGRAQEYSKR